MAIVQLTSTNPEFSFLIKKNPSSGMQLRSIRKGIAYGWYTNDATYNVYFKDSDHEVSYKQHANENFEYLNVSRYNTPLFPLNAINEFFSNPLKVQDNRDTDGYEHAFYIPMIHIETVRYIELFNKHMKDFSFEIAHQAHKSYSLTIKTTKSLYRLMHAVSVLCLFLSLSGNEYIDISDSILEKYIKSVHVIDAPFYIRNLFVRNFLTSREQYRKFKTELEQTSLYEIRFDFGGTALQRRNYIGRLLSYDKSILDVGCGEGYYAFPFAPKLEGSYYAIDINETLLEALNRKARSKEIDNIATFGSLASFLETYSGEQVDIILTEVIEHMSEEEAVQLILQLYRNVDFDRFIITTPNADFNPFYELSEFRHADHRWEMGQEQFQQWLLHVLKDTDIECEFVGIGDAVNGIQTTQGAILSKRRY